MADFDDFDDEIIGSPNAKGGNDTIGKGLFIILFLPSVIVAFLVYVAGRWGRLRVSVLSMIVAALDVLSVLLWKVLGYTNKVHTTFVDWKHIPQHWSSLIGPVILGSILFGGVLGLIMTWWEFREMKRSPHRLELEGDWMYHFQFRRTPMELLRKKRLIAKLREGNLATPDKLPLGLAEEGDLDIVHQYTDEAKRHTLIAGNTGSGKSITLMSKIRSLIQMGVSITIIDFKRDPNFSATVAKWVEEFGGDFRHFQSGREENYDIQYSKGPCRYDPLASGSPTAKADMVLNMREYDKAAAVWRDSMKQLLQVLFNMLDNADHSKTTGIDWDEGGLYLLQSAAKVESIRQLAIACKGTESERPARELFEQLAAKDKTLMHSLEQLQGQIRTITASEYGRWLRYGDDPERNISLLEQSQQRGAVTMFSLNSDAEPEFAQYIGSMIMSDLSSVSAARLQGGIKNRYAILVDEFQILPTKTVTGLLQKSRASKIEMTLALQSFEMIAASEDSNGESQLRGIIDTCGSFIIHAGMSHDSAERLSKILGKHHVTTHRASSTNKSFFLSFNWAARKKQVVQSGDEERWVFEPSRFIGLTSPDESNGNKSTAVYVTKNCADPKYRKSGPVARVVWMIPASDVLVPVYDKDYRAFPNGSSTSTTTKSKKAIVLEKEPEYDPEDEGFEDGPSPDDMAAYKAQFENEPSHFLTDDDLDNSLVDDDDGDWGISANTDEEEAMDRERRAQRKNSAATEEFGSTPPKMDFIKQQIQQNVQSKPARKAPPRPTKLEDDIFSPAASTTGSHAATSVDEFELDDIDELPDL